MRNGQLCCFTEFLNPGEHALAEVLGVFVPERHTRGLSRLHGDAGRPQLFVKVLFEAGDRREVVAVDRRVDLALSGIRVVQVDPHLSHAWQEGVSDQPHHALGKPDRSAGADGDGGAVLAFDGEFVVPTDLGEARKVERRAVFAAEAAVDITDHGVKSSGIVVWVGECHRRV